MSNGLPGAQWTWKWVLGLVIAGLILFAGQRAMTFDSRLQVLENKANNIYKQLDRIEQKIDRIESRRP